MRTTIRLNEELARRAKQYAHHQGRTFTELVTEAISVFISRPEPPTPRKRIILPTSGNPHGKKMTEKQYRALIEQMYEDDAKRVMNGYEEP